MDQSNQIKYANDITFVESFLEEDDVILAMNVINKCEQHINRSEVCKWTQGLCAIDTPEFQIIHQKYQSKMEEITGLKLKPTYTFWRLSLKGTRLPHHFDRPPCEVSVTINVGYSDEKRWPFYIDHEKRHKIVMNLGDAVVYNGIKYIHWRNPLVSDWVAQLCLHYVNIDGPYKDINSDAQCDQLIQKDMEHMKKMSKICLKLEREYAFSTK